MKSYKIIITAELNTTHTTNSIEEARKIADIEAQNAYMRLNGRYQVDVVEVEEVDDLN